MGVYNVHAGHNSIVPGAGKYLDEVTEDRKVKDKVISYLRQAGHTVYDCTDDAGRSQSANLANIVKKCNAHSVDLDISIHLNAGGGTGVEVLNYDSRTKTISDRICANISSALGIRNRGTKYNKNLYVLANTRALALLVECCFVDSQTDKAAWDVDKCAKAIAEGVLGTKIQSGSSGSSSGSFLVKVLCDLNIRSGPGVNNKLVGTITDKGTYTIVETRYVGTVPWGRLKSGAGWISIHEKYVKRV